MWGMAYGANRSADEYWVLRGEVSRSSVSHRADSGAVPRIEPVSSDSISLLLFDAGGVVIRDPTIGVVMAIENQLNLEHGRLHSAMYEGEPWKLLSVGAITEEHYWTGVSESLELDSVIVRKAAEPAWGTGSPDADVVSLIRELQGKYRIALFSNATLTLERQLADLRLSDLFDPIINSARIRHRKPDPAAFRHTLDLLRVSAAQVLFIDDKERNTRVAEELGMATVVFDGAAQLRAELLLRGMIPTRR